MCFDFAANVFFCCLASIELPNFCFCRPLGACLARVMLLLLLLLLKLLLCKNSEKVHFDRSQSKKSDTDALSGQKIKPNSSDGSLNTVERSRITGRRLASPWTEKKPSYRPYEVIWALRRRYDGACPKTVKSLTANQYPTINR